MTSSFISVIHFLSVSTSSDESEKQSLYPDGDPDRHQNLVVHLFIGPLPTFPENFMQIRSEVFAKLLTGKQPNNDEDIIFLVGGNDKQELSSS